MVTTAAGVINRMEHAFRRMYSIFEPFSILLFSSVNVLAAPGFSANPILTEQLKVCNEQQWIHE